MKYILFFINILFFISCSNNSVSNEKTIENTRENSIKSEYQLIYNVHYSDSYIKTDTITFTANPTYANYSLTSYRGSNALNIIKDNPQPAVWDAEYYNSVVIRIIQTTAPIEVISFKKIK